MYHKTLANQLMLLQIMGSPETIIIFVFFQFRSHIGFGIAKCRRVFYIYYSFLYKKEEGESGA